MDLEISYSKKDLLDIESLSKEEILLFLNLAENLKEVLQRPIPKVPTLRGRLIVFLFYEPSTRTKLSFERAAKVLSAETLNFTAKGSSIEKGETLLDTVKNLIAIGGELFVIRHPMAGAPHFIAKNVDVPVVNAGDGFHAHPTQALLDLLTVKEKFGDFKNLKIAIIGDILHSRVAHSDMISFQKLGAEVWVYGPPNLLPEEEELSFFEVAPNKLKIASSLEEALEGANVVIALRIQKERHRVSLVSSLYEYFEFFGLKIEVLEKYLDKNSILMHPGPINWGVELSPEIENLPFQVILDQVENGVAVRMAVFLTLFSRFKSHEEN